MKKRKAWRVHWEWSHLQWDAIREARVGPSHHPQHPGHLTGCDLSHPILNYNVSALIQTRETDDTNMLALNFDRLDYQHVNRATIRNGLRCRMINRYKNLNLASKLVILPWKLVILANTGTELPYIWSTDQNDPTEYWKKSSIFLLPNSNIHLWPSNHFAYVSQHLESRHTNCCLLYSDTTV